MKNNNLRRLCSFLAIFALLAVPADARTRKGDRFLKEGRTYEDRKMWSEAVELYEQALATDPSDPAYLMAVRRARFQSSQQHVLTATRLRDQGQLEAAAAEFQKAILMDPGSAIALQEWKRTMELLEREKSGGKLEGAERGLTDGERARKEMDDRAAAMLPPPELKPISQLPTTLKMNNQPPKVLYETIGKLAGINVVFDPQFQAAGRNFNIDLSNSTLEHALDYLAVLTKTFWKPISANTILVTEDNITKRRDYEDNVVRVFYVQNATSVQEFQEIATAVRSLTEIRRVFTYNAQRAILMRGTPDQIALAEKLIHDLDKAKAEVVVDLIVMEANRSRTRDLAAAILSGGKPGLNIPVGFTPRNPILTGTGATPDTTGGLSGGLSGAGAGPSNLISLAQIGRISSNDFSTTLPGALLQLVVSDRQTRVLQSPQVRASDGQKVTLRIGDKIPYATGAFQSGLGGGIGGMPFANTQFNFAEVGVNVDITPTVHGRDEVTLKIAVEVSNVRDRVSIGGIEQPVIGQRRSETEIRLREGEVNILGGLAQDQDSRAISGIPGLVNIPVLGRLLGSESVNRERGELLIALIPHVVRTPNLTDVDLKGVAAGTDQVVKVSFAPRVQAPAAGAETAAPAPAPTVTMPVQPETPPATPPTFPGVPTPTGPRLMFTPPAMQVALSAPVNMTLQAENMQDLFTASPIRVKWDPTVLRLNEITPGELLARDGQRVTSAKDIRNDTGEAWVTMNRLPGAGGVNGSGGLVTLSFTAIGKGNTKVTITEFGLRNTQLQPIIVTGPEMDITVQ